MLVNPEAKREWIREIIDVTQQTDGHGEQRRPGNFDSQRSKDFVQCCHIPEIVAVDEGAKPHAFSLDRRRPRGELKMCQPTIEVWEIG